MVAMNMGSFPIVEVMSQTMRQMRRYSFIFSVCEKQLNPSICKRWGPPLPNGGALSGKDSSKTTKHLRIAAGKSAVSSGPCAKIPHKFSLDPAADAPLGRKPNQCRVGQGQVKSPH